MVNVGNFSLVGQNAPLHDFDDREEAAKPPTELKTP